MREIFRIPFHGDRRTWILMDLPINKWMNQFRKYCFRFISVVDRLNRWTARLLHHRRRPHFCVTNQGAYIPKNGSFSITICFNLLRAVYCPCHSRKHTEWNAMNIIYEWIELNGRRIFVVSFVATAFLLFHQRISLNENGPRVRNTHTLTHTHLMLYNAHGNMTHSIVTGHNQEVFGFSGPLKIERWWFGNACDEFESKERENINLLSIAELPKTKPSSFPFRLSLSSSFLTHIRCGPGHWISRLHKWIRRLLHRLRLASDSHLWPRAIQKINLCRYRITCSHPTFVLLSCVVVDASIEFT